MKKLLKLLILPCLLFSLVVTANAADIRKSAKSQLDLTEVENGTFSAKMLATTTKTIAVTVTKDKVTYQYFLDKTGKEETFILSQGNGSYLIKVLENVSGNKYTLLQSVTLDVKIVDEFAPYLRSNQYVAYTPTAKTVAKAKDLTKGAKTDLEKVEILYGFVAKNIVYDTPKSKTVQTGYVPVVDQILASQKGICFDFSAVLGAMLRSQNIPTRMVTGYVAPNNIYHAWNEIYLKSQGWVKTSSLKFDGKTWTQADATFASAVVNKDAAKNPIGDGSKYTRAKQY